MAAGADEAGKEEVRLGLYGVAEDELCALSGANERQPHDAIAELGVGLHDGVLGSLGLFPVLATLAVLGVNLRPPRCKEDWISIPMPLRLLDQSIRKRVADEISAGEGIANAAIEVDGSLSGKALFAAQGSDGMTLDANGNVIVTIPPELEHVPLDSAAIDRGKDGKSSRETLDIVDRAYILHDGTVLMDGRPSEIVAHQDVRRVYLGERFSL